MNKPISNKDYQAFTKRPFDFHSMILNADLGEGGGNDKAIMQFIHAANIACGGHAGNSKTMRETIKNAISNQLIIGAHPSYEDQENFGRKSLLLQTDPKTVIDSALKQISQLQDICIAEHAVLRYIKPHGALYHDLNKQTDFSLQFIQAIKKQFPELALIGFAGSDFMRTAKSQGLEIWPESFIDRRYDTKGLLVDRNHPSIAAVLDKKSALAQALSLHDGWLNDNDGNRLTISSKTLCLHSDTPDALEIAKAVAAALENLPDR